MSDEGVQLVCAGLLGAFFYARFFFMFYEAALRGSFSFRLGEINGNPARVIGIIGLLGLISALYIGLSDFLEIRLPLWPVASVFLALAVLMVLVVGIWGIFNLVLTICKILWYRFF